MRLREPFCRLFSVRSPFLPGRTALLASSVGVAWLLGAVVVDVLGAPVAPQVSDAMADAIPVRGCVLYVNPTLALLDDRFTSDVSGCPEVIDWLGQERVLDNGVTTARMVSADKRLQGIMGRWIEDSDVVVLEAGDLGLNDANVDYLYEHFDCRLDIRKAVRIYVRDLSRTATSRPMKRRRQRRLSGAARARLCHAPAAPKRGPRVAMGGRVCLEARRVRAR